jgi:predicted PurR-regulated permease PerM
VAAGGEGGTTGGMRAIRAPSQRALLAIAAITVVVVVLYLGREALTPFIVGLLFVYLLSPGVDILARRGLPRWLAILVLYAVVAVVLVQGLSILLRPLVSQLGLFVADAPRYAAAVQDLLDALARAYQGLDLPIELRRLIDDAIGRFVGAASGIDPSVLFPVATSLAALVGNVIGYLIIPIWAFYLLRDRSQLLASLEAQLPRSWRDEARTIAGIVDRVIGRWLRAQLILGTVVGVVTFVGLLLLGALVDPVFGQFAVLLAVIAGILELVPIIGPTIAAIPAALIGLTAGLEGTVLVVALYVVIQQLENNLLVPKIQGDAVRLHPSVVIFAIVLGATIAGLLGAILALPVTAVAREIYEYLAAKLPDEAPATAVPATAGSDPVATEPGPRPTTSDPVRPRRRSR